jgi:TRAP-type uncharacterized transport system fused permease subunit
MKDKISYKTIIISAIVTALFTVLTTLLISYIQSKKQILEYSVQSSIPFHNDSLCLRIFSILVENTG